MENALSKELLDDLHAYTQTGANRNNSSWPKDVVKESKLVLIKDLDISLSLRITSELNKILPTTTGDQLACMWYGWTRGSYIPWHEDGVSDYAITIHLSKEWDSDWGGYFGYEENGEVKCIKPEYNKLVCVRNNVRHTVFSTTPDARLRETIQIFQMKR